MVYVVTLSYASRSVDNEMERNWKDMALRFCNVVPVRLYLSF